MDFKQIQDLVKLINKSELTEFKLEQDGFKLTLKKEKAPAERVEVPVTASSMAMPGSAQAAPQTSTPTVEPSKEQNDETSADDSLYTIKSPMIGTFYRSSAPDKEPFVKVGDVVGKGDHICIIEAMKLFNEIESEVEGKIVKVLTEDAAPVEYDQPLFLVELT